MLTLPKVRLAHQGARSTVAKSRREKCVRTRLPASTHAGNSSAQAWLASCSRRRAPRSRRRPRPARKGRGCGSTWTRRSSTMPTTRSSMRPTSRKSPVATRPTAKSRVRGSGFRGGSPTAPRPNAPVNVFIHGGAWRGGLAKNYAFPAELFVHAGAHFVVLDFAPVQDFGGHLMMMAEQVRRAVAWVYRNAREFGGDPNRLYVSGHSSGAHLGGVVLVTDWQKDFNLPVDTVKGGLLCSGMYDLKPVRLSARSSYVKFTDEMEHALSTQRHLERLNCPTIVAHGTLETPEFQRQTRDFAAAAKAAGKSVQLLVAQGYNHFEIYETLASPFGLLGRAVLEQMKLAQS